MNRRDESLTIHQVVANIHRRDAGPSYSVPRLAAELSSLGCSVTLHTLEPAPNRKPSVPTKYYRALPVLRSLGISPSMRRSLAASAEGADILHSHGLWMMPNVYPAAAINGTTSKLVLSPRGMLTPTAVGRSSRRKRLFWLAGQQRILTYATVIHATSEAERVALRQSGIRSPIAVIPIGIDVEVLNTERNGAPTRTLLYLGRVDPIKNVDSLVRAWARLAKEHPGWRLRIAGPGERGYIDHLRELAADSPRLEFCGPAYGARKKQLLAAASIFVLPSHTESFGVAVAEALAAGLPVVVSAESSWSGVVDRDCGWLTGSSVDSIIATLGSALSTDDRMLTEMGAQGRTWMADEFSWIRIATEMAELYEWCLGRRAIPHFVDFEEKDRT